MTLDEFFAAGRAACAKAIPYWRGSGRPEPTRRCQRCGGSGTVMETPGGGFGFNPGNRMYPETCWTCGGSGKAAR